MYGNNNNNNESDVLGHVVDGVALGLHLLHHGEDAACIMVGRVMLYYNIV